MGTFGYSQTKSGNLFDNNKRQLHFGQAPTTRQPLVSNDDTKNNPFNDTTADDQIRPLSGLGTTLTSAATLATAKLGSLTMPEVSIP